MNDRDKEIEALAERIYVQHAPQPDHVSNHWIGICPELAFSNADDFIAERDKRRATRTQPPAPEAAEPTPPALPTDRMGILELLLRCSHALGADLRVQTANYVHKWMLGFGYLGYTQLITSEELTRLQALAAELTAKDGRDG